MNNKPFVRTARIIAIFALCYFIFQIVAYSSNNEYTTQQANLYEYDYMVELDGFIVKNEELIISDGIDVIQYQYDDAEKITANTVIAKTYESESDLINTVLIEEYTQQRDILKSLNNKTLQNVSSVVDTLKIELDTMLFNAHSQNFSDIYENNFDIFELLVVQELILDSDTSYDNAIESMDSLIINLQNKIWGESFDIVSENAGYFSSKIDGYENLIDKTLLEDMTMESFEYIMSLEAQSISNAVGKIVENTNWNFVGMISNNDLSSFKVNSTYYLKFNSLEYKIPATISQIIIEEDSDSENSLIILDCDILNEDIINLREEQPYLCTNKSTSVGIKIDRDSIRLLEIEEDISEETASDLDEDSEKIEQLLDEDIYTGQIGVYIDNNGVAEFKKIDIISKSDDYVMVSVSSDKDYVQLYDNVIVSGKDLYDGKTL